MKPYLISKTFDLVRLYDVDGKAMFDSNNLAIYVQGQSPSVPTNNGIGVLADAASCKVAYELNGQDELVMTYPVSGQLFDQIELRDLIVAEVGRRGNQPYRIYRITKPLNGIVTIYARHLAYDLSGIVVEPFSASNIVDALAGLKSHAMTNNPFTLSTTRSTSATFTVKTPDSVWALMGGQEGSLLDVYGGEYTFDGYNISLENSVGTDNGVSVRYGVNMTDLEQDENIADCYTGVVAYWANEDDVVYSPVVAAVGTYGYVKILSVDMSDRWDNAPSVERLTQAAQTYITKNKIGVPEVSWKIGFVPLDMTEEYKDIAAIERVSIGDTVTVKFEKLGVDATSRVVSIEWDVLLDRYVSVTLGSVKTNIATTIAKQASELKKVPTTKQMRDLATTVSTTLTKAILGANGGSVRFLDTDGDGEEDTLYIANNKDPSLATKVWRFNYQGWGASSNGYNGPFVLGATLDNGLLASFVTAANLTAGRIRSADGTTFDLDLDNGTLTMNGYASKTELATSGGTTINGGNITTGSLSADRIYGGTLTLGGANEQYGVLSVLDQYGDERIKTEYGTIFAKGDGYEEYANGSSGFLAYYDRAHSNIPAAMLYVVDDNPYGTPKMYFYKIKRNGSNLADADLKVKIDGSETSPVTNGEDKGTVSAELFYAFDSNGNHNITWTSKGVGIPSGTDILTLGTGRYYCENNSTAAGLTNCPTSSNFALFVFDRNTSSNRKNYILHDADNEIYINAQTGNATWRGWRKITTTSV